MLQQANGSVDAMLPNSTSTVQHQSAIGCFVPSPSYSLPANVSPVSLILPYVYPPNDSVVTNMGDINCQSQQPNPIPISTPIYCDPNPVSLSTPMYCDSNPVSLSTPIYCDPNPVPISAPIYCDTHGPCVMYRYMCSPLPISMLSPTELENQGNSESLIDVKKECDGRLVMEYSVSDYPSSPSLLKLQEEKSEETVEEMNASPLSSTNLDPESTGNSVDSPHETPTVAEVQSSEPKVEEEQEIGVFGIDGCWYPLPKDVPQSCLKTVISDSFPQAQDNLNLYSSDWQQYVSEAKDSTYSPHKILNPDIDIRSSYSQKTPPSKSKINNNHTPLPFYNHYHHLNLPIHTLGRPRLLHTHHKDDNELCVEGLWKKHMVMLFRNLPDAWVIFSARIGKKFGINWNSFKDLAKVRFYCRNCRDGWTSMYGVVLFYYKWDRRSHRGLIFYQVLGQKCGNCDPKEFELPLWYPEEAQKVITNLYYKIATHFYNLVTPQYIRTRRMGQPLTYHNKQLCQGCCQGVCKIDCNKE
ncbi:Receptor-transporting protein 3-like 2 [Homarus americanus]|uniref:Receptor-transporting protein 3-like 2 n=1 Tax=Homarus americanus TaxID=6706 RepID=A0A8J5TCL3_HOMAM|nr:Receptor-transporting protein 3-like 2 [Homarus americanus]